MLLFGLFWIISPAHLYSAKGNDWDVFKMYRLNNVFAIGSWTTARLCCQNIAVYKAESLPSNSKRAGGHKYAAKLSTVSCAKRAKHFYNIASVSRPPGLILEGFTRY